MKIDVPAPAVVPLTDEEFYSKTDPTKVDMANLKKHLVAEGRLTKDQALFIVRTATKILSKESSLVEIEAPLTGDYPLGLSLKETIEDFP